MFLTSIPLILIITLKMGLNVAHFHFPFAVGLPHLNLTRNACVHELIDIEGSL